MKEVIMRKIGYIRNSRLVQENSVSVQTKLIKDFCKTHNIKLDKIIIDEGISGSGDKTKHRDGYQSVMDMINNGTKSQFMKLQKVAMKAIK